MHRLLILLVIYSLSPMLCGCNGETAEGDDNSPSRELTASRKSTPSRGDAAEAKAEGADPPKKTLRFRMPDLASYVGRVVTTESSGRVRLKPDPANWRLPDADTDYLTLLQPNEGGGFTGVKLMRARVLEVRSDKQVTIQLAEAAAKHVESGVQIHVFQPPGAEPSDMRAAPDIVDIQLSDEVSRLDNYFTAHKNLKRIALGLQYYVDTHGALPPAVVYGPDGEPWHSWRVLILPFIEQSELYEQYRMDEPWNGPNNSKLLEKIPQVYIDPAFGSRPAAGEARTFTNYAVPVGPNAVFTPEGQKISDAQQARFDRKGLSLGQFADGVRNTLLAAQIPTSREIPWTKPDDVSFVEDFPRPGEPNSFAAPYDANGVAVGLVVFAGSQNAAISSDIDSEVWRSLIERGDGNNVTAPRIKLPYELGGPRPPLVFELHTGPEPRATLGYE